MRAWEKILLGLFLVGALLLRGWGISHDLDENRWYHPDTPKQVRAVQQYLSGQYYKHFGLSDYDGYPLFHARIAELVIRVVEPVRAGFLNMIGVEPTRELLHEPTQIYWLFLLMNVLLSTATVLIVFHAGRESIGPPAGWIAALLMVVSPADVTCAHLATGDMTTAFFAALALFHVLRVYRLGRIRDYALATLAATFAFAAKYYAATVFFALALAHISRCGFTRPALWLNLDAWKRIGVCAAVAVAALAFAIPGLVQNLSGQLADIWTALVHSTQRYPADIAVGSKLVKYQYSMRVNLPDLLRCISPLALFAIVLGTTWRARDARVWILIIGPVLYVFLAVGSRGMVNPVYHTAVTPPLFLLIALCCVAACARFGSAVRILSVAAIALVAANFARDSIREIFFYSRMDTRRITEEWVNENIPATFRAHNGRYTFLSVREHTPFAKPAGNFSVRSDHDPLPPGIPGHALHRIELEHGQLSQFRNISQTIYVDAPDLIRSNFTLPPLPLWPSQSGNEFIFDGGPEFLRSHKVFIVNRHDAIRRWLVTTEPLREISFVIRSVAPQQTVFITINGRRRKIRTDDNSAALLKIESPKAAFPSENGRWLHPFTIEANEALVKVMLVTQPPAAAEPANAKTASEFFAKHGIHPDYLDALPYLELDASQIATSGFDNGTTPGANPATGPYERRTTDNRKAVRGDSFAVWTGPLMLDPFAYRGKMFVRSLSGATPAQAATLVFRDVHGKALHETTIEIPPLDSRPYTELPFTFTVPADLTGCSLMVRFGELPDIAIARLEIRPVLVP